MVISNDKSIFKFTFIHVHLHSSNGLKAQLYIFEVFFALLFQDTILLFSMGKKYVAHEKNRYNVGQVRKAVEIQNNYNSGMS